MPVSGAAYWACAAAAPWKLVPGSTPVPIRCRALGSGPVRVAARAGIPATCCADLSRLPRRSRLPRHRQRAEGHPLIAEGEADVYPRFGPTTSEWDTAASQILLEEAGGGSATAHAGHCATTPGTR